MTSDDERQPTADRVPFALRSRSIRQSVGVGRVPWSRRGRALVTAALVATSLVVAPTPADATVGGPCTAADLETVVAERVRRSGEWYRDAWRRQGYLIDEMVYAMVQKAGCTEFTGGFVPPVGSGEYGYIAGAGLVDVGVTGSTLKVGDPSHVDLTVSGPWVSVTDPGSSTAHTMRAAAEVRYAGNPAVGLWAINPSTGAVTDLAFANVRRPCTRAGDQWTSPFDSCRVTVSTWKFGAADALAATGGSAVLFVPWKFSGSRGTRMYPPSCSDEPNRLCAEFGPDQYAVVKVQVTGYNVLPPTAGITWNAAGTPGSFNFSGNAAATSPATIARYDWDFGGGDLRPNASKLQTKTWTGEAASRTVTLTVTDSNGRKTTTTETLRPTLTITGAPTQPAAVNAGDTASLQVTVANDGPSTISGVTADAVIGPAAIATRSFGVTPGPVTLAPGTTRTFTVPFNALKDGAVTGTVRASGASAGATITATARPFTFTIGNPGLLIELSGQIVEVGRAFGLTMRVTNPGTETVENIAWSDPSGITIESGDDPPAAQLAVTHAQGPSDPLPTTLASKEVVNLIYVFHAPFAGATVLTASATGTTATTRTAVTGKQAITVKVVAEWSETARDLLAIQGLEQALAAGSDAQGLLDLTVNTEIVTSMGWREATAAQVTSLENAGIMAPASEGFIAALASGRDEFLSYVEAWVDGYAQGMDRFGKSGGQVIADLVGSVDSPEQRRLTASRIWEAAKELPPSMWANAGYLGRALLAAPTVDGLNTILGFHGEIVSNVATAVSEATAGALPLLADYAKQVGSNPSAAMRNMARFSGELTWTGTEAVATTAVGEAGTALAAKLATPIIKRGVGVFRSSPAGAVDDGASVGGVGVAGADAAEAMVGRMARAEAVMDHYQALPAGLSLDAAQITGKGGILAEDAKAMQVIIKDANAKYGMEFEVAVRTSEPLSAGIDGVAKVEAIKPKAVSLLDQMMGADPDRAGMVGLFKPTEIDAALVARLDEAHPGFAAKYTERYAAQKKLWDNEWVKPDSKIHVLTEAGERYMKMDPPRPITILNERPGNPVPFGLKYLEQLDEIDFRASHGIAEADVPAIKQQIARSNIDTFKAAPTARVGPKGTIFIDDAFTGKPFVSDLDIQAVVPKDGVWPKGVVRGDVQSHFKRELAKLERFPFHGWSDSAIDLPSDFYMAAVPFQLGNANPALALSAANGVASRLALLEQIARNKAAQLLAAGDSAGAAKLLAPFEKADIVKLKDPATGLYSSRKLLQAFPPGEKTINFTAGDIRVGYGSGGR